MLLAPPLYTGPASTAESPITRPPAPSGEQPNLARPIPHTCVYGPRTPPTRLPRHSIFRHTPALCILPIPPPAAVCSPSLSTHTSRSASPRRLRRRAGRGKGRLQSVRVYV
ncbi:hypothetical protein FOA52_008970 [Chlamydomonas sp. UWO 241]|nr:hypothetical protein FOA52_008970 [Chlamydomonas sp. UWO 241]